MLVRTVLIVLASVLLLTALEALVVPRERRTGRGAAALGAAANNPDPPQRPGAVKEIRGRIPPAKVVTANVGDVVDLTASAEGNDVVGIDQLGYSAPVSPGVPAQLTVVPPRAGNYAITLQYSGKRLGTLKVVDPNDVSASATG